MPIGSNSKHSLGRGISSLISDYDANSFGVEKLVETGSRVQDIEITKISANPNQPRKNFDPDALKELSDSIKLQGVIVPLIVEEITSGKFVIVAGERRYRASKLAGLKKVPCIVRSFTDMQRMEVSLIENIQREDLNPVEEAKAYNYLIIQQGIKQDELAQRIGKSRSAVTNTLRLLNLPANMLDSLEKGDFTPGHARALLSVLNPADREILYAKILHDALSVRQAEKLASQLNRGMRAVNKEKPAEEEEERSEEIVEIEEKFLSATGCKVQIKGKISKGKIVIPYENADELERIYQYLAPGQSLFDYDN